MSVPCCLRSEERKKIKLAHHCPRLGDTRQLGQGKNMALESFQISELKKPKIERGLFFVRGNNKVLIVPHLTLTL